ncbi:hypothetical protein LZK98_13550 [Sphingomonas cannabina]|uniref:hypothetical protein n=1 Tax=Sphingomonas cannabina TaxID=2899123 RepID=UPI001F3F012A|nr:hypothetical protein [Sphingomonas cannabina]UIJ44099.1 hypothetical protein LZK98_13550 [Sphingomonas cannabina]
MSIGHHGLMPGRLIGGCFLAVTLASSAPAQNAAPGDTGRPRPGTHAKTSVAAPQLRATQPTSRAATATQPSSELEMVKLQQKISERQRAIALAKSMAKAQSESQATIANNVGR